VYVNVTHFYAVCQNMQDIKANKMKLSHFNIEILLFCHFIRFTCPEGIVLLASLFKFMSK